MSSDFLSIAERLKRFSIKLRVLGFRKTLRSIRSMFRHFGKTSVPLANADPDLVLAQSNEGIRAFARRGSRAKEKQAVKANAARDAAELFPKKFISTNGFAIQYASFPALRQSKGLVVIFHGYLGFKIDVLFNWKDFDLLLPLDNFGWKNLGSWFWGETGSNHVELAVQELVQMELLKRGNPMWFCAGASSGAFGAIYHGIKYRASGIYAMAPIINLKAKINANRERNIQTSYTALADQADLDLKNLPDIYQEANEKDDLPPLFLVQNQYDRSNPFGEDTLPLLKIYDQKKAWVGLRIQPAIGHQGHDGSYEEAQLFFNLIADKKPPRSVTYFQRDESST